VHGETLICEGDENYDFHVVLEGLVAVIDDYGYPDERLIGPTLRWGQLV
jgi:hypothetical protein